MTHPHVHIQQVQKETFPTINLIIPRTNKTNEGNNNKEGSTDANTTTTTRVPSPYALCYTHGHATNKYPTLPKLRKLLHTPIGGTSLIFQN